MHRGKVPESECLELLTSLGAANIEHLNGSLLEHLQATYRTLRVWQCDDATCLAGLFHAVYGTQQFERPMQTPSQRADVAEKIGEEVEYLVYCYCACDRDFFYPQIGRITSPVFRDRYTGDEFELTPERLKALCEITLANELDVVAKNPVILAEHFDWFVALFQRFEGIVKPEAYAAFINRFR